MIRLWKLFAIALFALPWAAAQPVISGITNALGAQTTLAPDSVFAITGTDLGPSALALPNGQNYHDSLGGTSISFSPTGGGSPIPARMVYSMSTQVSGLLPSSIAPGTYAVTVAYQSQTSTAQNVTVAARSLVLASADGSGNGPAQANDGAVNNSLSLIRLTTGSQSIGGTNWTLTPAHPGDPVVLWGTGGGADAKNDTGGSSGDQTAEGNFQVSVDGTEITPFYSGTATIYPGLWQVNFYLPADIDPDCFANVQVTANGMTSNTVTISIAAPGQPTCSSSDPTSITSYLSPAALARLDSGGLIVEGFFALFKLPGYEEASGDFLGFTATELAIVSGGQRFGSCVVSDITGSASSYPGLPSKVYNAGNTIALAGPNIPAGTVETIENPPAYYGLSLTPGTIAPGTYTITGSGGPDIGPFTATTVFPAEFTPTNIGSITTIDHTQPLTITWTETGVDLVQINVTTDAVVGGTTDDPIERNVSVQCHVDASLGSYTIPAAALGKLLLSSEVAELQVFGLTEKNAFTAPLVAGGQIDYGYFSYQPGNYANVTVK
jgi:uncharacterized protein (TIGR03437 family)